MLNLCRGLVLLTIISFVNNSLAQDGFQLGTTDNLSTLIDSLVQVGDDQHMFPGLSSALYWSDSMYYHAAGKASLTSKTTASEKVFYQLGSLGKLLTAIAILQQVDQGKLDLHADVDKYLPGIDINSKLFTDSITLHCLLTHSCGFNDVNIGYMTKELKNIIPLADYIESANPGLFQPPGQDINYSNFSYALAGLVIEKITSSSFESYISENLFDVLEMSNSSLSFPVGYEQNVRYAKGYIKSTDGFSEVQIHPRHAIPAGSLISNTADMGKFIKALFEQDIRLLSEYSWNLFYTQQFTNHQLLNGYAYGLEQQNINNKTSWAKGGMLPGMLSNILIVPDEFAFFSVVNTNEDIFGEFFFKSLFDKIHPNQVSLQPVRNNGPVTKYAGEYRDKRANHGDVEKIISLFRGAFYVHSNATADTLFAFHNANYYPYIHIEQGVFQNVDLPYEYLIFKNSEKGVMNLYRNLNIGGLSVPVSYEKTAWYNSPTFINEYYAFVPLLVFTGLIFSLLSFILRIIRIWRKEIFSKFLLPLRFKLVFGVAVLLTIIHTVTGPIHLFKNTQDYLFGYPTCFEISTIVGYLLGLLNLWLAIECFQLWKKKQGSLLVRVYVSIVTFALFMHIVYLFYWKFL